MSLISGSYSRAWGGGGAPDCLAAMTENWRWEEGVVRGEAVKFARDVNARGVRRGARDCKAGVRRDLEAVRTPRLIVDIVNST